MRLPPSPFWEGLSEPVKFYSSRAKYDQKVISLIGLSSKILTEEKQWFEHSLISLFCQSNGLNCIPKPIKSPNIQFYLHDASIRDYWKTQRHYWPIEYAIRPNPYTAFDNIELLTEINRNCFCCYLYRNMALAVKFPDQFHLNCEGELHCNDGPATVWKDGCETWHLNGVLIPKAVVKEQQKNMKRVEKTTMSSMF